MHTKTAERLVELFRKIKNRHYIHYDQLGDLPERVQAELERLRNFHKAGGIKTNSKLTREQRQEKMRKVVGVRWARYRAEKERVAKIAQAHAKADAEAAAVRKRLGLD